ncbi:hypothetical protein N7516_004741 [Penicillium verrucosum]|nr:uncharacterized protein N7516_004741 [Penicillium verrucosum]KAJ5944573.1 hypothetical protein N7516_004741 [Penicillium verrucosum]
MIIAAILLLSFPFIRRFLYELFLRLGIYYPVLYCPGYIFIFRLV